MSKLFSISKNPDVNYLASIQRIEKVDPIPNADRLQKTTVNGYDMIISKDMKVGDIVLHFPVECCISEKFLSANNLYERAEFERNSNAEDVKVLIENAEKETDPGKKTEILNEVKGMCGFFNSKGRVRILKLRGEYSQGFVCGIDALLNVWPELNDPQYHFSPENFIGERFDTVMGDKICWKYVPEVKNVQTSGSQSIWKKRMRTLKRFDRLVPGTFAFHYDTTMLGEHFKEIDPESIVTMTVKVHGTSGIFANIPVNRNLTVWEKVKKFLGMYVPLTEYGDVYSSRSIIKNEYINKNVKDGFYDSDIWGCVNKIVFPLLNKDMTVYGEIVGYLEGTSTYIQKNHDYGCKPGEWKFMPYRITTICRPTSDGAKYEWNVEDVIDWTNKVMKENPDVADNFMPMTLLYHGPMKDLYPNVPVDENWHDNVLEMLKTDAKPDDLGHKGFCMELREPLCKNKVPREGIVFRIDNDIRARAWKLKTKAHYGIEAMQHDEGEADIEETS